ncbi:MAG: diaminopimelate epimerase [Pseudomonadota bacterium]
MTRIGPLESAPLAFRKMHGLGNDFVVIDQRTHPVPLTPPLVRAIGDRHRGVGFDQLAEIWPCETAAAEIRFWNSDGSTAGACGNATRCIADLLMGELSSDALDLITANGRLAATRQGEGLISVDMGPVHLDWQEIPLARAADTAALPLPGSPGAVSVGNPHCVLFIDDLDAVDLAIDGPQWEHHQMFPERTNVEFCKILAPDRIRVRVWERGGMITQACGSGACAVVVAAVRRGLTGRKVEVLLDGGTLQIEWRESDGHVVMTGPVAAVFEGTLPPEFILAATQ